MASAEQRIRRPDGSEVKIIARDFALLGGAPSVGVHVLRRASSDDDWTLCSDRPHPDWRKMSVDEYIKHGRSEMFRMVTHGEIFKVASALQKPVPGVCVKAG